MTGDFLFPPYITVAHLYAPPRGWRLKPRQVKGYQLQYCKEGTMEYIIDGSRYDMTPGTLLLIRPDVPHEARCTPDTLHVCYSFVFQLGSAEEEQQLGNWLGASPDQGNWSNHPLEQQLSQLATLYHQPGHEHRLRCQSLLLDILASLVRRNQIEAGAGVKPISDLARGRMNQVKIYIQRHYEQDIRLEKLEEIAGIGRNHIINRFRRIYGVTPIQYLTRVRIEQAKTLALQTNLTVSEIAFRVGYADVHTFGRAFKRVTGTSLSQYCSSLVIVSHDDVQE